MCAARVRDRNAVSGAGAVNACPQSSKESIMQQGWPLSPEGVSQVKTVRLPPMLCGHCGVCAVPTLGPGTGPHVAQALCSNPDCRRFLRWMPKALFGGQKEECIMGGVARCVVVGVIGKHGVEVRYSTSGSSCASLTIVVTEQGQDGRPHDLYVPIEVWGKRAEAVGQLEPGQLCLFEGKLAKRKKGEQWELLVSGFDLTPIVAPMSLSGNSN